MGCFSLVDGEDKYCPKHKAQGEAKDTEQEAKRKDYARKTAFKNHKSKRSNENKYKTYRWRALSRKLRSEHPYCAECGSKSKRLTVHHLIEGELDDEDFFNPEICLVLCVDCHNKISGRQGGTCTK